MATGLSRQSYQSLRPARVLVCALVLLLVACEQGTNTYYPLEDGLRWQYRVVRTVASNDFEQRYDMTNLGVSERQDGQPVYAQSHNHVIEYFVQDKQGLWRLRDGEEAVERGILVLPTESGPESWPVAERTIVIQSRKKSLNARHSAMSIGVPMDYRVADRDAVTEVPAGRFEHCVLIEGVGFRVFDNAANDDIIHVKVMAQHWYAPGVGLVRSERFETSDSRHLNDASMVLELERFIP